MPTPTILIVDDEPAFRWALKENLKAASYQTREADTAKSALAQLCEPIDLVLLDRMLPDGDGMQLLERFHAEAPELSVILMTAYFSIENAVEGMRLGAAHYTQKPFNLDALLPIIAREIEATRHRRCQKLQPKPVPEAYSFDAIIGDSAALAGAKRLLIKIAQSPASTVLLTGETGTGKDLAAKAIHFNSARSQRPFMNITCSALPEALLESELFGHERGAFTDAKQRKRGLLEEADGGTVFLDEIGEMALGLQAKLLRFLEEKAFKRVGGTSDLKIDVRLVAATNRDLEEEVKKGSFRQDLYYRLSVMPVGLPPLRERMGDVPLLVAFYVQQFNLEFNKNVRSVSDEAMIALNTLRWPGNVRELRNAVERAMLLAEGDQLTLADFPALMVKSMEANRVWLPPGGLDFEELERDLVVQALERTSGNQSRAATLLGMNRDQIRYRIEKFGISHPRLRGDSNDPGPLR